MNAHMERHIRNIKEECLDPLVILGTRRLDRVLADWKRYFNEFRASPESGSAHTLAGSEGHQSARATFRRADRARARRMR